MKISELKQHLTIMSEIALKLPDNTYVPEHFHLTEVGLVTKHFIDCGGTERKETNANFQLWVAGDTDHRLTPQRLLQILALSEKVLGTEDPEIEVEYQQDTIGKYGLEINGNELALTTKHTACLAQDACGIPDKKKVALKELTSTTECCTPGGGRC